MDDISLRNWFAGMALQGMIAGQYKLTSGAPLFDDEKAIAELAFKVADAMTLLTREGQQWAGQTKET